MTHSRADGPCDVVVLPDSALARREERYRFRGSEIGF